MAVGRHVVGGRAGDAASVIRGQRWGSDFAVTTATGHMAATFLEVSPASSCERHHCVALTSVASEEADVAGGRWQAVVDGEQRARAIKCGRCSDDPRGTQRRKMAAVLSRIHSA